MGKLTLDALQERANALDILKEKSANVVSHELLKTISGGTENDCHDEGSSIDPESGLMIPNDYDDWYVD